MEEQIAEMQKTIESLNLWKQEYSSAKQSVCRMSIRLRKLCKKLAPESATVIEMRAIAEEIRELVKNSSL
jgi:uncharacterized coiled-coil protein SlyX